jgi:hypothetical protein
MPYTAQISRTNPACVLLLIDQSESMGEAFAGDLDGRTKADVVADAVNRLLQNLVLRSAKADGVRDYFHVGVIGYGSGLRSGLGGKVPYEVLVPISKLGDRPLRVETRTREVVDLGGGGSAEQSYKFPVWFDPQAAGRTPMCEAFAAAGLAVKGFIDTHPKAFPPIVLNLTDGKPTDGNPQKLARAIRDMTTADGNALVFNLLISAEATLPVYFLADEGLLTDLYSKLLFRMSSALPPKLWEAARAEGFPIEAGAKGVVFNADPTAIVRFLDIGTRVSPGKR